MLDSVTESAVCVIAQFQARPMLLWIYSCCGSKVGTLILQSNAKIVTKNVNGMPQVTFVLG